MACAKCTEFCGGTRSKVSLTNFRQLTTLCSDISAEKILLILSTSRGGLISKLFVTYCSHFHSGSHSWLRAKRTRKMLCASHFSWYYRSGNYSILLLCTGSKYCIANSRLQDIPGNREQTPDHVLRCSAAHILLLVSSVSSLCDS